METLTVTQRELTVSGITASDKIYDGSTDVALDSTSVTITNIVSGETLDVSATGSFSDANAGSGKTVNISNITIADDSGLAANYKLASTGSQTTATADITAKMLTITVDDIGAVNKIYDGDASASKDFTFATGIGDETVSLTASGVYASKDVNNSAISGDMTLAFKVTNGNYALSNSTVTGVSGAITQVELTVTANAQTITYGESADLTDYNVSGWIGAEREVLGDMSVTGTLSGAGFLTAGTEHKFDGSALASTSGNYSLVFTSADVTVNKLALTHDVSVTTTKVYDGNTSAAFTGGLTNVFADDAVVLNAEFNYNSKDVLTADTLSASTWNITGTDADNYELAAFAPISGAITPKTVDAVWTDKAPYYYNGQDQGATISASYTDINGEAVALDVSFYGPNVQGSEFRFAGSYTAKVQSQDANYTVSEGTAEKSYVMNAVGMGNVNSFSEGMNSNYSATRLALLGKLLARNATTNSIEGNLYTARYAILLSIAEINTSETGFALQTETPAVSSIVSLDNADEISINISKPDWRLMTRNNLASELSSGISRENSIIHVDGFVSGNELFNGLDEEISEVHHTSEFSFKVVSFENADNSLQLKFLRSPVRMHRSFFADSGTEEVNSAIPGYDIDEIPTVDLPRKNDMFKSEFERILDDMLVTA